MTRSASFCQAEGAIRFDLSPCPRFSYPEDFDREKFDSWMRLSGITAGSTSAASGTAPDSRTARNQSFDVDRFVTVTFRPNPKVRPVVREGGWPARRPKSHRDLTDQVEDAAEQVTEQVEDSTEQVTDQATEQVGGTTEQVAGDVGLEVRLLRAMSGEMTRRGIQEALGLRHRIHFREAYLLPALQAGLTEMTIPDKPRSSKQRYRLTSAGRERLRQLGAPR